jgi:alkyl sulfatase BDS1-like metallo-beta-lactamase superfamily hydrolase
MEPAIEQISERVYSAVGFDVANATFVVGKDGLVVIDAMLSIENMTAALRAFREISEYGTRRLAHSAHRR